MSAKLKIYVFGLLLLTSFLSSAQQKDSVTMLDEIVVEQSRLNNYVSAQYVRRVDSAALGLSRGGSVADLLRKFGYGNIRSYGPGGLTTASLRGTGSSHTAVLWNGINLISPLNGTLDLSLVPVSFIDDVSIQSGGAASIYGNGSIGGTIQLNNKAIFNDGLRIKTFSNVGSFGSFYQDAGAAWSSKKFITSTKFFCSRAQNDFEFINRNYFPARTETRDHSGYEQKGLLQQNYWQLSSKNVLHLKFWYQDNYTEVPNTIFTTARAKAIQKDTYYRSIAGWDYSYNRLSLSYQGAFILHDLVYNDSTINFLVSSSTFRTSINNVEGTYTFSDKVTLTTAFNYTWEEGRVAEYGSSIPSRNRLALVSAFKWIPNQRWKLSTSFREELVNGAAAPFSPSVTATFAPSGKSEIYFTASRNYRIPTFNDLYWIQPGFSGDPTLKTEVSVSTEAGFTIRRTPNHTKAGYSVKGAIFNNNVDNWIQWTPISASGWSPRNIKEVWSRGAEIQGSVQKKIGKVDFTLSSQYTFSLSTNETINGGNVNETGKQLMFTPIHQASGSFKISYKKTDLTILDSWTGKQYTDSDNSEFFAMKPYNVLNVWISRTFSRKKLDITLNGEFNNLLNEEYQGRPGYPMPGRNFKAGLTINFNKRTTL